ncbi:uncharacterized protein LOC121877081 isoform X2 [Homarus americanus]|uniref:uncharacterized protein LOC121877081 isoform X2 n=1 Tax=Homarus americanus TaxID=6706 RepID=UPI001C441D17|nr:uncharacterized protein LOC121877081 isoform X2 [Homarus americanus]
MDDGIEGFAAQLFSPSTGHSISQQQVTSHDLGRDFRGTSTGSSRQFRVTSGEPGVDMLLTTLGDSVNGDQRTVMALLKSLMVDGAENTMAMQMVRKTAGGRKKGSQGPLDEPLQDQGQVEGHLGPELGQIAGQMVEAAHQQMAEFTLEPHLGPAILPFDVPEGYFVPFLPRRAFGVENGVSRPPHGHGSFYTHRPPGLVDVPNSPAFGFLFSGYRRFDPEAIPQQQDPLQALPPQDIVPESPVPEDDLRESPVPQHDLHESPVPQDDPHETPVPEDDLHESPAS